MSRIALAQGPFCMLNGTNGYNFSAIWDDPRGFSGSDLGFFRIAQECVKLGHDVTVYTFAKGDMPSEWETLKVRPYVARGDEHFDSFVSWNEPDVLHAASADVRAVSLQINSIVGNPSSTDAWFSPSQWHLDRLHHEHPSPWFVVPDGTDLEPYDALRAAGVPKIPGRVVWTSSPDRGLHWLLQEWPLIKRAVPHATLRVFYKMEPWLKHFRECDPWTDDIEEQRCRARYIEDNMPRLKGMGVEFHDSVSRRQIVMELTQAESLAYSCDTVAPSEGFSCSLIEGCAAAACPISTAVDAFPEIYGGHIPLVPLPFKEHAPEFRNHVIRALTDPAWREENNRSARALAEKFTWALAAKRMCDVLEELRAGKAKAAE